MHIKLKKRAQTHTYTHTHKHQINGIMAIRSTIDEYLEKYCGTENYIVGWCYMHSIISQSAHRS